MRLLLFDFDGTLYRGNDPFWFYAQSIAQYMDQETRTRYLDLVTTHLNGRPGVVAGDNWEAVVKLAAPIIPDRNIWQKAFLATRQFMMSPRCRLEVPPSLVDFLRQAAHKAKIVVASNSPAEATGPLMEKLGLTPYFDAVFAEANKPEGLVTIVGKLMETPYDPHQVFSVGDNYANDIAPAVEYGWLTAHISPHGYFPGPCSVRAHSIEEVLPTLSVWMVQGTLPLTNAPEA